MTTAEMPAFNPHDPPGSYRHRFANAEYDEVQNMVWVAGQPVSVEPLPLQLLAYLLRRSDEVVTRSELFDALWQGRPTVDNVLANAISKLRRALGEEAGSRLVNLPRIGYRLQGPVASVATGRKTLGEVDLSAGQPVPGREDFLLVRQLGQGATSTVWLAQHERLPQCVVFKFAQDGDQLAALKRECTAYRLLFKQLGQRSDLLQVREHNFLKAPFFLVYDDAGTDLRRWANGHASLRHSDLKARLGLFLKIAHAVAAAHSVGVLHRDLKPGNVLIDDRPQRAQNEQSNGAAATLLASDWQVRLTDFGSSLLLAPDRLAALGITATGTTVSDASPLNGSTPYYLAPELLAGESPTMRSDLYALGLMLYQILAGDMNRPLTVGWEHDIPDALLIEDVRAATEGRPERRLASVAQLIERLESLEQRRRQREEAAEGARRMQAATDRLREIRGRRAWLMALTVCFALGGVGAAWFGVQAHSAQREAERANARSRAINDFLNVDILRSSEVNGTPGATAAMIDVLARASDRAGERFKDDMSVLAQVRRQLGDIYMSMSFADLAENEYQRAIAVLERSVPVDDEELLAARFGIAQTLTGRDEPQEALTQLEAAERAAGPGRLARADAFAQRALRTRVQVLLDARRYEEALPSAVRLVQLSDEPTDVGGVDLPRRLQARQWLCEIHTFLNNEDQAAKVLNELESAPFNVRNVAATTLARVQLARARDHIRQNRLREAERLLGSLPDASTPGDGLQAGMRASALFEVYRGTGRFEEALQASGIALRAYRSTLGERHSWVTISLIHVALAELDNGNAAGALRGLDAARLRLDANGHYGDQFKAIDLGRARALTSLGRPHEAVELLSGLSPSSLRESQPRQRSIEIEIQAELGRALLADGQSGAGQVAVAGALEKMIQGKSPAWTVARYQPLMRSSMQR